MKHILIGILILFLLTSCNHTTWIRYNNGIKEVETFSRNHKHSTSYTKRGKIVFTDSISGKIVKVEKYCRKVACFGGFARKHILITYDTNGKKIERKNLLRVKVKNGEIRENF